MALAGAYTDWVAHLAASPGKQLQLWEKAARKSVRLAGYVLSRDFLHGLIGPLDVILCVDKDYARTHCVYYGMELFLLR
jgi:polyhydroxyalkanoate synthase